MKFVCFISSYPLLSLHTLQMSTSQGGGHWFGPKAGGAAPGIDITDVPCPKAAAASLTFSGEVWIKQGVSAL